MYATKSVMSEITTQRQSSHDVCRCQTLAQLLAADNAHHSGLSVCLSVCLLDDIVDAAALNKLLTLRFTRQDALFEDVFPGTLEFDRWRS